MRLLVAPRAVPTLVVMAETGLIGCCSAACRMLAELRQHGQGRGCGRRLRRMRCAGSARSAVLDRGGCRAAAAAAAPVQCRARAPRRHGRRVVAGVARDGGGGGTSTALPARAGALRRPRAARLDALAGGAADTGWHDLATLPERWPAPAFPLRAADFLARGLPKGAGARRGHAGRRGSLDRGGVPERIRGARAHHRAGGAR